MVWGELLGTGVAVALAAEKPVGRVILEAPFTSAAAVGAKRYWYMPVRLLMKDQFHSDERIGKVTAPLLILHGVHDQVVPFAMGERLFELANKPKHIVRFLDGGHEDLDANGALHRGRAASSPAIMDTSRRSRFRATPAMTRRSPESHALLRHGHQLEHVAVRIAKIDTAAAAPVVELAVFEAPRRAAEDDLVLLDAAEDGVEFAVADVERVMMAFELRSRRRTAASASC